MIKPILFCLAFFGVNCQFRHYADRFYRNKDYQIKSLAVEQPVNEIPTLKEEPKIEAINVVIEETTMGKKFNASQNQQSGDYIDIYRVSLNSETPIYRVVTVQKNNVTNETVILFNTFITFRDSKGYPYTQRKTADQVFFYPRSFQALMKFFFSDSINLNMTSGHVNYLVQKHTEIDNFFHVTIWMVTHAQAGDKNLEDKYRGTWLTLKEYQYLLSRASQLLKDLGLE